MRVLLSSVVTAAVVPTYSFGYGWDWVGNRWNSKQKPSRNDGCVYVCPTDMSEQQCQAEQTALQKQRLQIQALQEKLFDEGVEVPDWKYLDFGECANSYATLIAFLKLQAQNAALATLENGDCNQLRRENFCNYYCTGLPVSVSFGDGCKENQTPREITCSWGEIARFNSEVIAILKQKLQISFLEKELSNTSCDIC